MLIPDRILGLVKDLNEGRVNDPDEAYAIDQHLRAYEGRLSRQVLAHQRRTVDGPDAELESIQATWNEIREARLAAQVIAGTRAY